MQAFLLVLSPVSAICGMLTDPVGLILCRVAIASVSSRVHWPCPVLKTAFHSIPAHPLTLVHVPPSCLLLCSLSLGQGADLGVLFRAKHSTVTCS